MDKYQSMEETIMQHSPRAWKISALFLALALILLGSVPLQRATAEFEFPHSDAWGRVTPSIIWCDDPDSTVTFEVHIVGRNDVARVWITDLGTDEAEERAELFDDGTHGDAAAGDNVFTLAEVSMPCRPGFIATQGGFNPWHGMLRVELKNGTQGGNNYGIASVGMVHSDYKGFFSVQDFGNGLSATAYAFFIQDSNHEVMDGYPIASVTCGTSNFMAYRKLYSVLPDVFDFAMVMPGMQIQRPGDLAENVPYNVLVSNSAENIGMDILDNTAHFGSSGRLKSVIYHSFGKLDIFDHEVGHTWGMAIGQSLGLINEDYDVNQGHWNKMADIQGQMGAYFFGNSGAIGHFAYNGDETWHLVANTEVEPYSPLELYVMGLIPPEEVPPIHILTNPNTADLNRITATYRTVTIDQVIQAEGGPRNPTYAESQKAFSLAFIITQDVPFNDAAYAYFSLLAHSLVTEEAPESCCLAPFYWATGGRGTLTTLLPVDLPDPFAVAEPTSTEEVSVPAPATETIEVLPGTESTEVPPVTETPAPLLPICGSTLLVFLLVLPVCLAIFRKR
jgi:hypothetical protein